MRALGPTGRRAAGPPGSSAGYSNGIGGWAESCPGARLATLIAFWCPSSCSSRPRFRGSKRTTRVSFLNTQRSSTWLAHEPGRVREAWDGLGYYRRAANLHRLAQAVIKDHGGQVPKDPSVLITLPGVGRYTAGAVATFAYERPAAAVDTNVAPSTPAGIPAAAPRQRSRPASDLAVSRSHSASPWSYCLGIQSSFDGPGSNRLHRATTTMPGLSGTAGV